MTEPKRGARHPLADLPGIVGRLPRYRDLTAVQTAAAWIAGRVAHGAVRLARASVRGATTLFGAAARSVARAAANRRPVRGPE